jgi:spermidine/putrescine ABC transporter ATP-binding subunit
MTPRASDGGRIELTNLCKRYGSGPLVVDDVTIDIASGEFVTLLGPSGSGKTTTLNMIAGFTEVTSGHIRLAGKDISLLPPYKRNFGMVFQNYALFPHMTVAQNIAFPLRERKVPKAEIERRVAEVLELVDLVGLGRRRPDELSGGQQQRVALARAVVFSPSVLLLDEPLSALDRKLRQNLQQEIKRLHRELGLTFVFVTHDQDEAMALSDRIGVMNRGGLVQVASPTEIYEQPNSRWVAGFVGDVNLIEAQVAGPENGGSVLEAAGGARLRVAQRIDAPPGTMLWIGVRPEKILVSQAPAAPDENGLSSIVQDIGYLGDVSVFKVQTDNGLVLKAAVANRTRRIEQTVNRGDRVWLRWMPDAGVVLTQ